MAFLFSEKKSLSKRKAQKGENPANVFADGFPPLDSPFPKGNDLRNEENFLNKVTYKKDSLNDREIMKMQVEKGEVRSLSSSNYRFSSFVALRHRYGNCAHPKFAHTMCGAINCILFCFFIRRAEIFRRDSKGNPLSERSF